MNAATKLLFALMVTAGLCACGHKTETAGPAAATTDQNSAPPQPKLDCPSDFGIPAKTEQDPVDDIRGLRVGTDLNTAILFIRCLDPKANFLSATDTNRIGIEYYGRKVRTGLTLSTGDVNPNSPYATRTGAIAEDLYLTFVSQQFSLLAFGEPGQERVFGVEQTQRFPEGKYPAAATIADSLKKKYGDPQLVQETKYQATLNWIYDGRGRLMSPADPNYGQCSYNFNAWSAGCGVTLGARISKDPGNELLVREFSIGVVAPNKLMAVVEQDSEAWKSADKQRKLDEMKKAQDAGAPAKL